MVPLGPTMCSAIFADAGQLDARAGPAEVELAATGWRRGPARRASRRPWRRADRRPGCGRRARCRARGVRSMPSFRANCRTDGEALTAAARGGESVCRPFFGVDSADEPDRLRASASWPAARAAESLPGPHCSPCTTGCVADLDRRARLDAQCGDRAGERRRHFHRRLVGQHFHESLAGLDRSPGLTSQRTSSAS